MRFVILLFLFMFSGSATSANEPDLSMFDVGTQADIEIECLSIKSKDGIIPYFDCLVEEAQKIQEYLSSTQENLIASHICNVGQPIKFLRDKAEEFYAQKKYEDTFTCSLAGAYLNDPFFTGNVGWHYQFGIGVDVNLKEANEWYKKGIELDDNYSKFNLAKNLEQGNGITVDKEQSFQIIKEVAETGDPYAEAELAFYYLRGIGTIANYDESFKYFMLAAEKNNVYAQGQLGWMYSGGRGTELDYDLGFYWTKKAADQNDVFALANLGWHYQNGFGITINTSEAIRYYELAALQNNEFAIQKLEEMKNLTFEEKTLEQKVLENEGGHVGAEYGNYYALVIGIDKYDIWPELDTAVNDAKTVGNILEKKYNFQVTSLFNKGHDEIKDAIFDIRDSLTKTDNLLIYYAGHGELDDEANRGFWIPKDGDIKKQTKWISNSYIQDQMKASKAKHVLIVSDSCFSASLTRSKDQDISSTKVIEQLAKMKTRIILTSGGLGPVLDGGGETNHSIFAHIFIKALQNEDNIFVSDQIFPGIRQYVVDNAEPIEICKNGKCKEGAQTPELSVLKGTGHEGGDFIFVPN